jgi:hypothetical protein
VVSAMGAKVNLLSPARYIALQIRRLTQFIQSRPQVSEREINRSALRSVSEPTLRPPLRPVSP